jgi:hypothetical protein
MLLHPSMPASGPVSVVFDGTDGAVEALQVVGDLAQKEGGSLNIALSSSSRSEANLWRETLIGRLRQRGIEAVFDVLASNGAADVIDWARNRQAGLVVVSRNQQLASDESLDELLERCPTSLLLI